jgi:hypothetical protein
MTIIRTTEPFGRFRVTYDVITEESASYGDTADRGYLDWQGSPVDEYYESEWDLRDLTDKLSGHYAEGDGARVPRWITIDGETDFWLSSFWKGFAGDDAIGASVSVHRPDWITDASWLRVCRLLGMR